MGVQNGQEEKKEKAFAGNVAKHPGASEGKESRGGVKNKKSRMRWEQCEGETPVWGG